MHIIYDFMRVVLLVLPVLLDHLHARTTGTPQRVFHH
jgi:hypothetical protein